MNAAFQVLLAMMTFWLGWLWHGLWVELKARRAPLSSEGEVSE